MLSVVIPTLNAENTLPEALSALVPAAVEGLVKEVVIADGGSEDHTLTIADAMGAIICHCPEGRGCQLAQGAEMAECEWLLFIHADTQLPIGWEKEVQRHIASYPPKRKKAAVFKFGLGDSGFWPRFLEMMVFLRTKILRSPYGDQGLLISADHYRSIGGYPQTPFLEDVAIMGKIGAFGFHSLSLQVHTNAERYQRDGYLSRMTRNILCILLYKMGRSPEKLRSFYEGGSIKGKRND